MGKGIALQFKKAFPANDDGYRAACALGDVQIGRMFLHVKGSRTIERSCGKHEDIEHDTHT